MGAKRSLVIGYRDEEEKFFNAAKGRFEHVIGTIGEVELIKVASLESPELKTCDLLLTTADHVPSESFSEWLQTFSKRVKQNELIWIPSLIFADLGIDHQRELLAQAAGSNWYFDIISIDHLDSLPIRMANLIRIHDHLKELFRYDQQFQELNEKVKNLEDGLVSLKHQKNQA